MSNRSLTVFVCLCFLVCLGQPLFADITTFTTDFTSTSGLVFNGDAVHSIDNLKLVDSSPAGQIGSVWFSTLQSLAGGFNTTFQFSIGGEGGALGTVGDGLAFVIQSSADGTAAIGFDGGQVGFGGIKNSLAIEFASNAADNNAAFVSCGLGVVNNAIISGSNPCDFATSANLSTLGTPIGLADGSTHTANVVYTPGTTTLKLILDGQLVLTSSSVNLGLFVGSPALVGFTAATGDNTSPAQYGLTETARIFNWDLTTPEGSGTSVPEPSSVTLLGLGLASMVWLSRRKQA
jgi:hypothetical protein